MMKVALGTAQFGLDYGISNNLGQVGKNEIGQILDYCREVGIDTIDTAQGYGNSEDNLGRFNLDGFRIVSKIIGEGQLETTLGALRVNSIYALMYHRENEINDDTWGRYEKYKEQKLVKKIGASFYSPETLKKIAETYPIDIVQVPLNVLDQRFLNIFPLLKSKNIEIHVRSIFLQGLLLMDKRPDYFEPISNLIDTLPKPRMPYLINFAKGIDAIDRLVVGVSCLKELQEIVTAYNYKCSEVDWSKYSIKEERFINPSQWRV